MKILIDTNRIISALIKEGTTRSILFDDFFEFVTPDNTIADIEKYKKEIQKKAKLTDDELELVIELIFEYITVIPESEYTKYLKECKNDISDQGDIPHLAACLATKADGIWAHDPHFKEQNKVKIFTNIDMLRMSGKAKSD